MYNRYIRADNGVYTRIPQDEPSDTRSNPGKSDSGNPNSGNPDAAASRNAHNAASSSPTQNHTPQSDSSPSHSAASRNNDNLSGLLRRLLDQFHLESVDTGDLILLALLYFLWRENADDELLTALGLLLIL